MDMTGLRESFLANLQNSNDLDDPLSLHQDYIESIKACPVDEAQSKLLLEALERTTQAFIDDRRYANDPRYLRAWLDYASRCREPEDVFAFLAMRGICVDLAAYYEEYARYLERCKAGESGWLERILGIYRGGIERRAQPLERLKRYYNEFVTRRCPEAGCFPENGSAISVTEKRQSWSRPAQGVSCWVAPEQVSSEKRRPVEVHGYRVELLENGTLSFEEARAKAYRTGKVVGPKLTVFDLEDNELEDELDDVPSLAVAVNPDDLTHISVYRDNTTDLKELARLAAQNNSKAKSTSAVDSADKENVSDVIMAFAGDTTLDAEDPFEQIQQMKAPFTRSHSNSRLSLIPEDPEPRSQSQAHNSLTVLPRPSLVILTSEARQKMESSLNPGLVHNLVVVHESALGKVRQLEATLGRDGVGGNQTVSALRIANGHFFIDKRLSPASRLFLSVDLESDVSRNNQWALKIVSPPSLWESFIVSKLGGALMFPQLKAACHYNDVMFMALTYYEQGSLRAALQIVPALDEILALFYAGQLLRILSSLISTGIVHSRVNLDHLMIRSGDLDETWSAQYRPDGSQGWASKGLALLGFSKAVDCSLLGSAEFTLDGRLASHEHDLQDAATVLNQIAQQRSQFSSLWQKIFALLGAKYTGSSLTELSQLAVEIDGTLELASVQCSPTLKGSLTRLEIALLNAKS